MIDPEELGRALRATLAGFKVPRNIEIVDDLPRDDNGKIAKHRIRAHYADAGARTA
ncbi:hypothetical protein ACQEV2_03065 [Streptomyces sp. CA-251387]|uniref:hypothetical protein n=1 Tax=Streptomyces sp. CA-251387 TaxID=3240064 RepID=UPI003D89FBB8